MTKSRMATRLDFSLMTSKDLSIIAHIFHTQVCCNGYPQRDHI